MTVSACERGVVEDVRDDGDGCRHLKNVALQVTSRIRSNIGMTVPPQTLPLGSDSRAGRYSDAHHEDAPSCVVGVISGRSNCGRVASTGPGRRGAPARWLARDVHPSEMTDGAGAIVVVIGAGVTGSRVAANLAGVDGLRIGVIDTRDDVARAVARSVSGAVVELAHAKVADVVVLALPAPHAELARELVESGVAVVSMSDDVVDVEALLAMHPLAERRGVGLVVGAAMAPGLTGLLARNLAVQLDAVDEIHVAMHGTAGPACARQHHRALGGTSVGLHDGEWIRRPAGAGRELCWFPEPVNAYDCYRAEVPEPLLLHRVFPGVMRMSARMSGTRRDRFTARLPMLSPPHREGGVGAVRVELRGALAGGARETLVAGAAMRSGVAAAAVASAAAEWLSTGAGGLTGAIVLGDSRLPSADLLMRVRGWGVPLFDFTGVARPAEA